MHRQMQERPEERLQQGDREVSEHEGGVLVGPQQAPSQQQLGIFSPKGNFLQLQPFIAVTAAYRHHLQVSSRQEKPGGLLGSVL